MIPLCRAIAFLLGTGVPFLAALDSPSSARPVEEVLSSLAKKVKHEKNPIEQARLLRERARLYELSGKTSQAIVEYEKAVSASNVQPGRCTASLNWLLMRIEVGEQTRLLLPEVDELLNGCKNPDLLMEAGVLKGRLLLREKGPEAAKSWLEELSHAAYYRPSPPYLYLLWMTKRFIGGGEGDVEDLLLIFQKKFSKSPTFDLVQGLARRLPTPSFLLEETYFQEKGRKKIRDASAFSLVQVGAYRSEVNAQKLKRRLASHGYKAMVSKRDDGYYVVTVFAEKGIPETLAALQTLDVKGFVLPS